MAGSLVACSDGYKSSVESLLPSAKRVEFVNVKKYAGGSVCGLVRTDVGSLRFMVGPNGKAYVEDDTPIGFKVFNMTETSICRDR